MGKARDIGIDGDSQNLIKVWNRQMATIDTVDYYGDDDIHDNLLKVFPIQNIASSGSKLKRAIV